MAWRDRAGHWRTLSAAGRKESGLRRPCTVVQHRLDRVPRCPGEIGAQLVHQFQMKCRLPEYSERSQNTEVLRILVGKTWQVMKDYIG